MWGVPEPPACLPPRSSVARALSVGILFVGVLVGVTDGVLAVQTGT
jgi:hypothetical protein